MTFIDTDLLIQQRAGRLLQQILDEDGMDAFLRAEQEALCTVSPCGAVVATGGSAVYSQEAMAHLKDGGTIVFLDVPFDRLRERLTNMTTRGIVRRKEQSLRDVYDERLALYRAWADVTVDCADKNAEQCVEGVLCALEKSGR